MNEEVLSKTMEVTIHEANLLATGLNLMKNSVKVTDDQGAQTVINAVILTRKIVGLFAEEIEAAKEPTTPEVKEEPKKISTRRKTRAKGKS